MLDLLRRQRIHSNSIFFRKKGIRGVDFEKKVKLELTRYITPDSVCL